MTKRIETDQLEYTRRCTGPCKEEYQLTAENFSVYTTGKFKRQCRRCEAARSKTHYKADPKRKNQQVTASRRKKQTTFNAYRRERNKRIMAVYCQSVASE